MAEWRRVDKKLYSDKKIMRLSRDARLLFIGLITIAGDDGYGDADPCVLKAQLFPGDDLKISEIEGWRTELHTLGLIRLWSKGADLFYNLPNWDKYQVVNFDRRGCKKHLLDTNGLTEVTQDTERVPSEHREHIQTDSTVQTRERDKSIPASPVVDNSDSKSTKATQTKGPSLAQRMNQEDVGDVLVHWSRRFPHVEIKESLAQKIIAVCQDPENWRDPRWLIDQVNIKADDPVAYLAKLLRTKPLPQPADGERAYWSWDRWRDRTHTPTVGIPVGNVVNSIMGSIRDALLPGVRGVSGDAQPQLQVLPATGVSGGQESDGAGDDDAPNQAGAKREASHGRKLQGAWCMTSPFEATIAELKTRRDKIDSAIAALEELDSAGGGAAVQTRITAGRKTESAKPTAQRVAKKVRGAKSDSGSTRELVVSVLRKGPARSGAVIKALGGKLKDFQVYQMLNYLKSKGEAKVNDDRTYELVGE